MDTIQPLSREEEGALLAEFGPEADALDMAAISPSTAAVSAAAASPHQSQAPLSPGNSLPALGPSRPPVAPSTSQVSRHGSVASEKPSRSHSAAQPQPQQQPSRSASVVSFIDPPAPPQRSSQRNSGVRSASTDAAEPSVGSGSPSKAASARGSRQSSVAQGQPLVQGTSGDIPGINLTTPSREQSDAGDDFIDLEAPPETAHRRESSTAGSVADRGPVEATPSPPRSGRPSAAAMTAEQRILAAVSPTLPPPPLASVLQSTAAPQASRSEVPRSVSAMSRVSVRVNSLTTVPEGDGVAPVSAAGALAAMVRAGDSTATAPEPEPEPEASAPDSRRGSTAPSVASASPLRRHNVAAPRAAVSRSPRKVPPSPTRGQYNFSALSPAAKRQQAAGASPGRGRDSAGPEQSGSGALGRDSSASASAVEVEEYAERKAEAYAARATFGQFPFYGRGAPPLQPPVGYTDPAPAKPDGAKASGAPSDDEAPPGDTATPAPSPKKAPAQRNPKAPSAKGSAKGPSKAPAASPVKTGPATANSPEKAQHDLDEAPDAGAPGDMVRPTPAQVPATAGSRKPSLMEQPAMASLPESRRASLGRAVSAAQRRRSSLSETQTRRSESARADLEAGAAEAATRELAIMDDQADEDEDEDEAEFETAVAGDRRNGDSFSASVPDLAAIDPALVGDDSAAHAAGRSWISTPGLSKSMSSSVQFRDGRTSPPFTPDPPFEQRTTRAGRGSRNATRGISVSPTPTHPRGSAATPEGIRRARQSPSVASSASERKHLISQTTAAAATAALASQEEIKKLLRSELSAVGAKLGAVLDAQAQQRAEMTRQHHTLQLEVRQLQEQVRDQQTLMKQWQLKQQQERAVAQQQQQGLHHTMTAVGRQVTASQPQLTAPPRPQGTKGLAGPQPRVAVNLAQVTGQDLSREPSSRSLLSARAAAMTGRKLHGKHGRGESPSKAEAAAMPNEPFSATPKARSEEPSPGNADDRRPSPLARSQQQRGVRPSVASSVPGSRRGSAGGDHTERAARGAFHAPPAPALTERERQVASHVMLDSFAPKEVMQPMTARERREADRRRDHHARQQERLINQSQQLLERRRQQHLAAHGLAAPTQRMLKSPVAHPMASLTEPPPTLAMSRHGSARVLRPLVGPQKQTQPLPMAPLPASAASSSTSSSSSSSMRSSSSDSERHSAGSLTSSWRPNARPADAVAPGAVALDIDVSTNRPPTENFEERMSMSLSLSPDATTSPMRRKEALRKLRAGGQGRHGKSKTKAGRRQTITARPLGPTPLFHGRAQPIGETWVDRLRRRFDCCSSDPAVRAAEPSPFGPARRASRLQRRNTMTSPRAVDHVRSAMTSGANSPTLTEGHHDDDDRRPSKDDDGDHPQSPDDGSDSENDEIDDATAGGEDNFLVVRACRALASCVLDTQRRFAKGRSFREGHPLVVALDTVFAFLAFVTCVSASIAWSPRYGWRDESPQFAMVPGTGSGSGPADFVQVDDGSHFGHRAALYSIFAVAQVLTFLGIAIRCFVQRRNGDWEVIDKASEIRRAYFQSADFVVDLAVGGIPFDWVFAGWLPAVFFALQLRHGLRLLKLFQMMQSSNPLLPKRIWFQLIALVTFVATTMHVTALTFAEIEDVPYIEGLYWAIVTITSVGYGEVIPSTSVGSRLFASLVCILGVLAVAMVTAFATSFLTHKDKLSENMDEKKQLMHSMLEYYRIPWRIQRDVIAMFPAVLDAQSEVDFKAMVDAMPQMRDQLEGFTRAKTLQSVPIFASLKNVHAIVDLGRRMRQRWAAPQECIVLYGDIGREMYFVVRGVAEVYVPVNSEGQPMAFGDTPSAPDPASADTSGIAPSPSGPPPAPGRSTSLNLQASFSRIAGQSHRNSAGDPLGGSILGSDYRGSVHEQITAQEQVTPYVPADEDFRFLFALRSGQFFGERALVTNTVRSATVRAATLCELLVLDRDDFVEVTTQHRELRRLFRKELVIKAADMDGAISGDEAAAPTERRRRKSVRRESQETASDPSSPIAIGGLEAPSPSQPARPSNPIAQRQSLSEGSHGRRRSREVSFERDDDVFGPAVLSAEEDPPIVVPAVRTVAPPPKPIAEGQEVSLMSVPAIAVLSSDDDRPVVSLLDVDRRVSTFSVEPFDPSRSMHGQ